MTGAELQSARRDMGWTQQQLAAALGVALRTVKSYEAADTIPIVVLLAMRALQADQQKDRGVQHGDVGDDRD